MLFLHVLGYSCVRCQAVDRPLAVIASCPHLCMCMCCVRLPRSTHRHQHHSSTPTTRAHYPPMLSLNHPCWYIFPSGVRRNGKGKSSTMPIPSTNIAVGCTASWLRSSTWRNMIPRQSFLISKGSTCMHIPPRGGRPYPLPAVTGPGLARGDMCRSLPRTWAAMTWSGMRRARNVVMLAL